MINSQYINTLLTKFAAARSTRLNLVKQAGMVYSNEDRADRLNSELDYRGIYNASPSSILSLDPSRNSAVHPSQMFGDITVDALDQSWSNPDIWTQNAADYVVPAGLGALGGGKLNEFLTSRAYGANGIPLDKSVRGLDTKGLGAYTHLLAGNGKGNTSFSVGATPPGLLQQLRTQLSSNPIIPSNATPATNPTQREKAMRAATNAKSKGPGETAVTAPLYRRASPPDWSKAPAASGPVRNSHATTVQMQTEIPGKSLTGNPKTTVNRNTFRPNESTMAFNNRPGALKALGRGAAFGAGANALKNFLYHNTPWAPASIPLDVDQEGYLTDSSQAKLDADRDNAGR